MNYSIIKDEIELTRFIEFLPELNDGEYSNVFFQNVSGKPQRTTDIETGRLHVTAYDLRCQAGMSSEEASNLYHKNKAREEIDISVCLFNDKRFDVIIKDNKGHEVMLSGNQDANNDDIEFLLDVAPACVFTKYKRIQ